MVRALRSAKQVANKIHEVAGSATYANGAIRMSSPVALANKNARIVWAMLASDKFYERRTSAHKRPRANAVNERINKEVSPSNCNKMAGDGETVIPSLPEPGVWTGMASANVLGPLRWKRAKIHRGSRRRNIGRIRKPDIRQQL